MANSKQAWTTPQLIVLARGAPQEHVLEICYDHNVADEGPGRAGCGHVNYDPAPGVCVGVTPT